MLFKWLYEQGWYTPSSDGKVMGRSHVMIKATHLEKWRRNGENRSQGKGIIDRDFGLALKTL